MTVNRMVAGSSPARGANQSIESLRISSTRYLSGWGVLHCTAGHISVRVPASRACTGSARLTVILRHFTHWTSKICAVLHTTRPFFRLGSFLSRSRKRTRTTPGSPTAHRQRTTVSLRVRSLAHCERRRGFCDAGKVVADSHSHRALAPPAIICAPAPSGLSRASAILPLPLPAPPAPARLERTPESALSPKSVRRLNAS
jgi:hypothetical protein